MSAAGAGGAGRTPWARGRDVTPTLRAVAERSRPPWADPPPRACQGAGGFQRLGFWGAGPTVGFHTERVSRSLCPPRRPPVTAPRSALLPPRGSHIGKISVPVPSWAHAPLNPSSSSRRSVPVPEEQAGRHGTSGLGECVSRGRKARGPRRRRGERRVCSLVWLAQRFAQESPGCVHWTHSTEALLMKTPRCQNGAPRCESARRFSGARPVHPQCYRRFRLKFTRLLRRPRVPPKIKSRLRHLQTRQRRPDVAWSGRAMRFPEREPEIHVSTARVSRTRGASDTLPEPEPPACVGSGADPSLSKGEGSPA